MKKLLVLTLVLGAAGIASAGFQVTAPAQVGLNEDFQIVIYGALADMAAPISGGVYGNLMAKGGAKTQAAGNLGAVIEYPEYGGWDFIIGDIDDGNPGNQPAGGDWITFMFTAPGQETTIELGVFDYAVSFDTPVYNLRIPVIPEPMTLGLLSLGALFLRRRK